MNRITDSKDDPSDARVEAAVLAGLEAAALEIYRQWNADGTKGERRVSEACEKAIRAIAADPAAVARIAKET